MRTRPGHPRDTRAGDLRPADSRAIHEAGARGELCLTGLWLVATLISEALSAGFADVASTAIPAHFEAKGNSLSGDLQRVRRLSGGFTAGPAEFLPAKMQAAAASALGSPPSGSRSGASCTGLSGTALTLLDKSLTSPEWRTWPATVRYAPCGACCQSAEAADGAADESGAACYG
jgi:hypothetical protein